MEWENLAPETRQRISRVLGYLNFSSGAEDPRFLRSLNELYAELDRCAGGEPTWRRLGMLLRSGLEQLRGGDGPFRDARQAEAVLELVFDKTLRAYRRFHEDLLFHQREEDLFQPFFIGRVCEAVLRQGGPWDEEDRIVSGAVRQLNDFVGHRPVAVLEGGQKMQPYEHEWVRPLPLYIRGAGVVAGRYHALVAKALEILRQTDPDLLARAWFDPQRLSELAVDPRAFDFDHPVSKRPNYLFGSWDPHAIDGEGYYHRFVLIQVTLDVLLQWAETRDDRPREEALAEAATVLAGTMLMGSGILGDRPGAHDSSVTLGKLLPVIAEYRDEFYLRMLQRTPQPHAARLRQEAKRLQQPFGQARQDLNQALARYRANQLQHVRLAQIFSTMGHMEAAWREAHAVPAVSARMHCQVQCALTAAHRAIDQGRLEEAAAMVPQIEEYVHRAIHCGAFADPWNVLGFGGQYSLFPAPENSVTDHRVEDLIGTVAAVFELNARLQCEAAARRKLDLQKELAGRMKKLAEWWDQFATTAVEEVDSFRGEEIWEATSQVAAALNAWHAAGTEAGNIAFWRQHVQDFRSPSSFAMLVRALLDQRDFVAAMALMMYWLSQAEEDLPAEGENSFHALAFRWMNDLWQQAENPSGQSAMSLEEAWRSTCKFFDYLEANAETYWEVPRFALAEDSEAPAEEMPEEEYEEEEEEDLFAAAYENVTYRDTTDDGFEGDILDDSTPASDFELAGEAERLSDRLAFLKLVAQLWSAAASASWPHRRKWPERDERLYGWLAQAMANYDALNRLLDQVHRYPIPAPRATREAMVEYDRRLNIKEILVERIIDTMVTTRDAARVVLATTERTPQGDRWEPWEMEAAGVLCAIFQGDRAEASRRWPGMLKKLAKQRLLYLPLARRGNPHRIAACRNVHAVLQRLLSQAPKVGLLKETYQLLGTIHQMERRYPVGPGAVTEFDRLFETGCRGILQCLAHSASAWGGSPASGGEDASQRLLLRCLEQAVDRLLKRWIAHSRNIRISVLEAVADKDRWRGLKEFIRRYGRDLFTQTFMNLGNLRAILYQGVDDFLDALAEHAEEAAPRLIRELGRRIPREAAAGWLELTIEAVVENYSEYVDYNGTTTQSDRGDNLYMLLDFLRLLAKYERIGWNLKPVMLAHEVLVRQGHIKAAETWRQMVVQRTQTVAEEHVASLAKLTRRYAMHLASVADRINERFVRPMDIAQLCALAKPAMEELKSGSPGPACARLEAEAARLAEQPTGAGFDTPDWLEALADQVDRLALPGAAFEGQPVGPEPTPVQLSPDEAVAALQGWDEG